MNNLPVCPEVVVTRAKILYHNGFGFQGPRDGTNEDIFILCTLPDDFSLIEKMKDESKVKTVKMIDWIGRDFLTVHWTEYNKRFEILTFLLKHNISFQLMMKNTPRFTPEDDEVNAQSIEHKMMEVYHEMGDLADRLLKNLDKSYNWQTLEGKEFCRQLRIKKRKNPNNIQSKHNYYYWDIFKNCNFDTLLDKQNINEEIIVINDSIDEIDTIDMNMCMICEDKEADTIVRPCNHNIVCQACSIKLKSTNNANSCILCRQPIERIDIKE